MKYRVVIKKLKRLGCREIKKPKGTGSHRLWENPETGTESAIPDWRGKDLKPGTLRGILKRLEIDYQTFLKI